MKVDENFDTLIAEIEAENKGTDSKSQEPKAVTKKTADSNVKKKDDAVEYAHKEIMEEEGLTKDELPSELRKMVITFDRKLRMAKMKKASEQTFLKIQNLSTLIGDKILDYLESKDDKFMDGGSIDDGGLDDGGLDDGGLDDGGLDDGGLDDGIDDGADSSNDINDDNVDIEDDIKDEDFEGGGNVDTKEKGGIFGGILGGIFDF